MTRPAQCIFRLAADAEHSGAQKHVESGGGVTCNVQISKRVVIIDKSPSCLLR